MHEQTQKIEIKANLEKCFQVICDFQNYPKWQKQVKNVTILEKEQNRAEIVEFSLDAILKTISYTLRYSYKKTPSYKLEWDYVGGDLKNIEGSYEFLELTPENTQVTFRLKIDIGKWVPGFVLNTFKDKSMKDTLESFKKRVENIEGNGG